MSNPISTNLNDFVDPVVAKQALVQHLKTVVPENSPQYWQGVQRINEHVDTIAREEFVISGRRLGELALLAQSQLGPSPAEMARQQLIESGHAVDRSKLPPAYAAQIAHIPDETIIEAASFERAVRPELSQKQAIDLWIERAKKLPPTGLDAANVLGMRDTRDGIQQTVRGVSVGNG